MRNVLSFLVLLTFLMVQSTVALGFHDTMPKEVYGELQESGVSFIEYDGPVLRKEGCLNVRRTLLKSGPLGRSLGMALFVPRGDGTAERLIGAEIREEGGGNPSFVWRSLDFWRIASCHFPDKYREREAQ